MSLARRPRGTEDADVDETPEPQLEAEPAPAPAPAPAADPEPLGAHAPGSDAARAAFIADAPAPPPDAKSHGSAHDGAPKPAVEAVPTMTWADAAKLAAQLVDTTGQLGGRLMKRPDVPWALSAEEKAAIASTAEPVMKQYLGGEEVTPLAALLMVLAMTYAPRIAMAAMTKPDAPPRAPAPPPPAPAPPAPPEKLPTLQRVDGKSPEW